MKTMENHQIIVADLTVRFRDVDAMGHVNNAVFLTYFEEGRSAFLARVLEIVDPSEYPFILARISCDYLRPLKLGDRIAIQVAGRVVLDTGDFPRDASGIQALYHGAVGAAS